MKCCHESVFMHTFATVLAKWRARAGSTSHMAFWPPWTGIDPPADTAEIFELPTQEVRAL
ncbi:hypothetical protein A8F26_16925 [Burkholderia cenocepacia]|jgi:hypothetical protein|nr:hypothetical protein A8F32_12000 [Burkholderia cenocepacia]ONI96877.1 hypothetical protein A8F33_32120 [Burkholderia cenocepacia]ONJ01404.1 hypothetical protein A8F53_15355 [Burkholderia cenocepacia]ONJ33727.1 hypothetical protein A8F38_06275 [Burkholderia cenocepacia]ONR61576.1 hypothetical protein A8E17_12465 [Burkholderia cenocepacia]